MERGLGPGTVWLVHAGGAALTFSLSIGAAYVLAATLLGERRGPIALGLTAGFAVVTQSLGLLWLPRVLPVGWASLTTAVILGILAVLALQIHRRAAHGGLFAGLVPLAKAAGPFPWILIVLLSSLVYVSAVALWFEGTAGRADVATLYLHSGLAASIARGNFPVTNMYEPEYAMTYRFAFHTLAAAAQHLTGLEIGTLLPHFVGALAVALFWTAIGVVGRIAGGTGAGIAGGALLWAGGPLYWTGALKLAAEAGWPEALGHVARRPDSVSWSGLILGPTFTMPTHNPTNILALIPALTAMLLFRELITGGREKARIMLLATLLTLNLTVLAAASEYFYPAVLAGCGAVTLYRMVRKPRLDGRTAAAVGAAAIVSALLSLSTASVLANLVRGDRDVLRLGVFFNWKGAGSFSSWGYNATGPFFEWAEAGQHEVAVVSQEFLLDGGLPLIFLLPLAIWAAVRPESRAAPFAAVGAAAFAAATLFHFRHSPPDIYRFANFGAVMAMLGAIVWIWPAMVSGRPRFRVPLTAFAAAGITALVGGFAMSGLAWPGMIAKAESQLERTEADAIAFLKATDVRDRLLVLWGSRTAADLYDPATPQVTAYISANTGQFIPYGYHHLSKAGEYAPIYGWAQQSLEAGILDQLKIKYIYANSGSLTDRQRLAIDSMLSNGLLEKVMDAKSLDGDGRIMYEYRPARVGRNGAGT